MKVRHIFKEDKLLLRLAMHNNFIKPVIADENNSYKQRFYSDPED